MKPCRKPDRQPLNEKLARLGLTVEQVRRHVVSVAPPAPANYYNRERAREFRARRAGKTVLREERER